MSELGLLTTRYNSSLIWRNILLHIGLQDYFLCREILQNCFVYIVWKAWNLRIMLGGPSNDSTKVRTYMGKLLSKELARAVSPWTQVLWRTTNKDAILAVLRTAPSKSLSGRCGAA